MLLMMMVLGCKDAAMEAENTKLQQRVADLERTNERLQSDNTALKASVARQEEAEKQAAGAGVADSLGAKGGKLTAIFETSLGTIHCTLRPDQAPNTVANFVQLARGEKAWTDPKTGQETKRPLYDGTIFHRVIPEFMIQGGDPLGNGTGGPGYEFADEVGSFSVFDKPGLLAMANAGPNTNGSQFFITESMPDYLNGKHTIFGDCDDQDVVKKIARVPSRSDRPLTDVVIKHVTIE
jgi:peptidyl-prolyl cis-trans isomerase A (cyclophilin A)